MTDNANDNANDNNSSVDKDSRRLADFLRSPRAPSLKKPDDAPPPAPTGAVMVVGGGIAGMQSSLDLANAGFKVFLVEALTAIGGRMAQIDKTFPTNDCSMCIMSPKLVDVGRHKNIEILTSTQVEDLQGDVGHFTAKLNIAPRYVKTDACTGCGECAAVCPVSLSDEHNLDTTDRHAIFRKYAQAIPGSFAVDKQGESPCRFGCPAHVNCHGYVRLIAAGRFAEALAVERRENPFPAVCGRICPHPCETECTRGGLDAPLAIAALKRFLTDWELKNPDQAPPLPEIEDRPAKVAIIGGGPAGLTAARELRLQGFGVTVFEALEHLGGMLRYGIPDYRLPPEQLDQEIKTAVLDLGVVAKTNTRVGTDVTVDELRDQGFGAFLMCVGAHVGLKLNIPGEDQTTEGIIDAAAFLRDVNAGVETDVKGRVYVVGGGNVAMDAARTALRLGAKEVTVLYRRAREQMPANPWEIDEAEEEEITFRLLCNPVRLHHTDGKLKAIKCIEMELGEPDASGRRRPVPVKGSEFKLDADFLIPAISQKPDLAPLTATVEEMINKWGTLEVDSITLQSETPDIFASGDAVSGPATAVEAIQAGKRAAESISRYLNNQDLRADRTPRRGQRAERSIEGLTISERLKMRALSPEARKTNFDEFELGYTEEEAIAEASRCLDCATCCECLACETACQADAVFHADAAGTRDIEVGSVVLAPGFETFPAGLRPELGYGEYKNVITALEFERLLSASGPTEGHVKRPSDGTTPVRVAWIQCVGSRDHSCDRDYCSSVCCMYASKEALIAKEHDGNIEPTIFYIDMRAFGKGFDDYVARAQDDYGVRYIRSMVSRVIEDPVTDNLEIRYTAPDGERLAEEFDLVVLSVGVQISDQVKDLAHRLDVDLDPWGFAETSTFSPLATNRQGVFVCGAFAGPKDIPETVSEASGAAGAAASNLAPARGTLITEETFPEQRVMPADEDLNIGVFVCHCGINIAAVVDVEHVAEYAKELPGVTYSNNVLYACSQDNQEKMREIIADKGLNRVVVASCSPRTHEPLFQQTLQQAGLNKYLFDMANIRDQCSWVHRTDNDRATTKSKRLLRMAVANVSEAQPMTEQEFPVDSGLLIIGGGLAGLTAAKGAADQGFDVYLVERENNLGGNLRNLRRTADGEDVTAFTESLIAAVKADPKIRVYTGSQVVTQTGYVGNFETEIMTPAGDSRKVHHGAVLLATGGQESRPDLYGLGKDDRVSTQLEFEQWLAADTDLTELNTTTPHVTMIQCAGSRDESQPYCSRVCCNQAIKNALHFLEAYPLGRVDILYRDIRSYGLAELQYRKARRAGVHFIRYDPESNPPDVDLAGDQIKITLTDPSIRRTVELEPDLLVLSVGMAPHDNEELGTLLRVPRADNGFFIEAHAKLRPVDFASDGQYLAGIVHGPKSMSETISQASAAVARAATILSSPTLCLTGVVSTVDPEHCAVCLTCVRACPYDVPKINEEHTAEINPALCQGCGICAAECPANTITLGHFTDQQLSAKLDAMEDKP